MIVRLWRASAVQLTTLHVWPCVSLAPFTQDWVNKLEFGEPIPFDTPYTPALVVDCQQQMQSLGWITAIAIGAGDDPFPCPNAYVNAVQSNVMFLWDGGVLYPILSLFCSIVTSYKEDLDAWGTPPSTPAVQTTHPKSYIVKCCCNILYCLLITLFEHEAFRASLMQFRCVVVCIFRLMCVI